MIYETTQVFGSILPFLLVPAVLYTIIFWELLWKGFGLWKAGRNNQPWWFFFILVVNFFGILPILYLFLFQKKGKRR